MYQNLHVLMIATTVCFLPVLSGCDDSKDSGISSESSNILTNTGTTLEIGVLMMPKAEIIC